MKCFMGDAQSVLRVLLSGDYLILHGEENKSSTVYLLSIRHHRQLTFKFARWWPGTGQLVMARRPHKNSGANATSSAAIGFDAKLWAAADGLRNNIDADDSTDVPSFCTCAALEEIRKHTHALTTGRYVGAQDHGRDWYSYVRCESVNIEWRGAIGARA